MDADDFRGMESELHMCEGARVLLTQNLWVEAGLMNGALGVFRGYMWPEGGDPHSQEEEKKRPLCVFVEFDSVNFGVDADGAAARAAPHLAGVEPLPGAHGLPQARARALPAARVVLP